MGFTSVALDAGKALFKGEAKLGEEAIIDANKALGASAREAEEVGKGAEHASLSRPNVVNVDKRTGKWTDRAYGAVGASTAVVGLAGGASAIYQTNRAANNTFDLGSKLIDKLDRFNTNAGDELGDAKDWMVHHVPTPPDIGKIGDVAGVAKTGMGIAAILGVAVVGYQLFKRL